MGAVPYFVKMSPALQAVAQDVVNSLRGWISHDPLADQL